MLETVEQLTRAKPAWTVLWLHGLGADGHDFAPIVPQLVRPEWPGIRFVFPHAKVRPVTINGGASMRAWYDIVSQSIEQRADEAGVRDSVAEVDALITRERDRGIPPSRLILVGFSQGGAVALSAGLRREAGVAGIASLSAYLPLAAQTTTEITVAGKATPVFLGHGTQDAVVPPNLCNRTRIALEAMGVNVESRLYPMGHSVCDQEINDLGDWMTTRFGGG